MSPPHHHRRIPPLLICAIFLLFLGDSLFQIAFPTVLVEHAGFSATVAGLLLSVGLGVGILFVAPVAHLSDRSTRASVLLWSVIGIAVVATCFALAASMPFLLWLWCLPLVGYGVLRTPAISVLLAYVTERGHSLRMQAANGITQRGAVAVAALAVAVAVASGAQERVFIVFALVMILLVGVIACIRAWDRPGVKQSVDVRSSYRMSLQLLRGRSLRASSALNASLVLVTILGNAFFPLGLLNEDAKTTASWVLIFLVTRDLIGSLLGGSFFKRIYERLGMFGSLLLIGILFVSGLGLLAIPGREPVLVLASALFQGFACAVGIGCTNILAAHGGGTPDRALRIGTTQYLPAIVLLLAPAPLGLVLDFSSIEMVFAVGAVLCASLMLFVLYEASPKRNVVTTEIGG